MTGSTGCQKMSANACVTAQKMESAIKTASTTFRDKQTITIISCQLAAKLSDQDNMPRGNTEKAYIDPRDLEILHQILPDNEMINRLKSRTPEVIEGRFKVIFNCTVIEIKQLLKELDYIRANPN